MWLPHPTPKMIEEFREIVLKEFDLPLSESQASDAATGLIQIHYLLAYANRDFPDHRPEPVKPPEKADQATTTRKQKSKKRSRKPRVKVVPHLHENESLSEEPPIPTIWCNGPFTNA
jgi:hypothetical protein